MSSCCARRVACCRPRARRARAGRVRARFLSSVDIVNELSGVQGIGFARMSATEDAGLAVQEIREHYGIEVSVRPETRESWRTPIVLLEPANARNTAALGFDMYADPIRRSAMDHAIASGEAQMSGPVELVQEITSDKQTGFLVYLPFPVADLSEGIRKAPLAGFVYAPFRGGDLIRARRWRWARRCPWQCGSSTLARPTCRSSTTCRPIMPARCRPAALSRSSGGSGGSNWLVPKDRSAGSAI